MADFIVSIPDDAVPLIAKAFTYVFNAEWKMELAELQATPATPPSPPDPIEFARQRVIAFIQGVITQYQTRPAPPPPPVAIS